jgi:hypothetical protein
MRSLVVFVKQNLLKITSAQGTCKTSPDFVGGHVELSCLFVTGRYHVKTFPYLYSSTKRWSACGVVIL